MKNALALLALVIALSAPVLRAEEEDSALEGKMKVLARGMRQLSQQITDPAMQQMNIKLLETLKGAANESKALEPRKTKEIPEGKRASFLADFRTDLDELKDVLNQVEEALKAGDQKRAQSLLAQVNSIKKEGHAKFKQD